MVEVVETIPVFRPARDTGTPIGPLASFSWWAHGGCRLVSDAHAERARTFLTARANPHPWEQSPPKLSADEILAIREDWRERRGTQVELARRYGCHPSHVSRIVNEQVRRIDA
jgi:hypothetical protein